MAMRIAVCALVTLAVANGAVAETIRDRKNRFRFELPRGFVAEPAATTSTDKVARQQVLHAYRHPDGTRIRVSKARFWNLRAWRRDRNFFDEVEQGVLAAAPGYQRIRKRVHRQRRLPIMDLQLRHAGTEHRLTIRFLFHRRYTIALAVHTNAHARKRRIARSLRR